jgi:hypothetical protein
MRKSLLYIIPVLALVSACIAEDELNNAWIGPTCYDGIQNQDEEDIDCGGRCKQCEVKIPPLESPCAASLSNNVVTINGTKMTISASNLYCDEYSGLYLVDFEQNFKRISITLGDIPTSEKTYLLLTNVFSVPSAGEAVLLYYENEEGPFNPGMERIYVFVKDEKVTVEFCDLKVKNEWDNTRPTRTLSGRISCQ